MSPINNIKIDDNQRDLSPQSQRNSEIRLRVLLRACSAVKFALFSSFFLCHSSGRGALLGMQCDADSIAVETQSMTAD